MGSVINGSWDVKKLQELYDLEQADVVGMSQDSLKYLIDNGDLDKSGSINNDEYVEAMTNFYSASINNLSEQEDIWRSQFAYFANLDIVRHEYSSVEEGVRYYEWQMPVDYLCGDKTDLVRLARIEDPSFRWYVWNGRYQMAGDDGAKKLGVLEAVVYAEDLEFLDFFINEDVVQEYNDEILALVLWAAWTNYKDDDDNKWLDRVMELGLSADRIKYYLGEEAWKCGENTRLHVKKDMPIYFPDLIKDVLAAK